MKPGAKNGIHDQVGGKYGRCVGCGEPAGVAHHQRRNGEPLEHGGCIPAQILGAAKQQNLYLAAGFHQLSCHYEAIASIIAFSANHTYALGLRVIRENEAGNGGTGVLHQRKRRNAVAFRSRAINLTHFRRAYYFHNLLFSLYTLVPVPRWAVSSTRSRGSTPRRTREYSSCRAGAQ